MIASEVVPYAKTGGLADVAGVLPRFLRALGHDVRLVMPRYYKIDRARLGLRSLGRPIGVPMGSLGTQWAAGYEGRLPGSDVPIYFLEHEGYYGRQGIYNDDSGQGFLDNDRRFLFLTRGALELSRAVGFHPDVVHANDWHTAAAPVLLDSVYRHDAVFGRAASLLTIHNMEYQGRFYAGLMDVLGVGWEHFSPGDLEWHGQVNLLQGGIRHATLVNTVSPQYAAEIQTPAFGHGLEEIARARSADLHGILNGIDYDEWDPTADRHIAARYHCEDLRGKLACKRALQREMRLPERDVPLLGIVSRLVHQKGLDILAAALDRVLDLDTQFVLLGSGEPWAQRYFRDLARRRPDRFACHIGYDNDLAHRIEAGVDLYVMPSRFEPCGLNQMYSLRYGSLPVVHAVGGLEDTVENLDPATGRGTGFKVYDLDPDALFETIRWAVETWRGQPEVRAAMLERAMRQRFSWEGAAARYVVLYREAVRRRTGRDIR